MADLSGLMGRVLKKVLKVVGALCALVVALMILGFGMIYLDGYSARKMTSKMQAGMTIEQVVAGYPKGIFNARALRATRDFPYRTESGRVEPPDTEAESGITPTDRSTLQVCEPIDSITIWGPGENDRFAVDIIRPGKAKETRGLNRNEFAALLRTGFSGSEFRIVFQSRTHGPYHLSSAIQIGDDGKIKEVGEVTRWD